MVAVAVEVEAVLGGADLEERDDLLLDAAERHDRITHALGLGLEQRGQGTVAVVAAAGSGGERERGQGPGQTT